MTDTSKEGLDALDKKLASQIGDDVQVIYDHEALFKQCRATITALRAEVERLTTGIAIWIDRAETAEARITDLDSVRADARRAGVVDGMREAAKLSVSFLVGDPENEIPLRNPVPHQIKDYILARADAEEAREQALLPSYDEERKALVENVALRAEVARLTAENERLREAVTMTLRADNLREVYHAMPNDHNRIGDKRSRKSHARDAWLRAFRKAAKLSRAALQHKAGE